MDLPTIPHDNLYKFMTFCGLMLCLASVVGGYFILNGHNAKVYDQYYRIHQVLDTSSDSEEATNVSEAIMHLLATEKRNAESSGRVLSFVFCIGLVCMSLGCWFWYLRIQRHDDRVKAAEADLAVKQAEAGVLALTPRSTNTARTTKEPTEQVQTAGANTEPEDVDE